MWFKIMFAVLAGSLLVACGPAKKINRTGKAHQVEVVKDNKDSTEYELIIFDPGFESWFEKNRKPMWYYTNDYLAAWNRQYVTAWNEKARNPLLVSHTGDNPFMNEIDYRPGINYGLELNHKLYHYFKYIEATWGSFMSFGNKN